VTLGLKENRRVEVRRLQMMESVICIEALKKKLQSGRCEVEDVIGFALKSAPGNAQVLRELSLQRGGEEKESARSGGRSFPLAKWLAIAAVFVESGYGGLLGELERSRNVLPFVLAFGVEGRRSPQSWAFFADLIQAHGKHMSEKETAEVLEALNRAFSFDKPVPADGEGIAAMHDYVLSELLSGRNTALALCAARGFPSQAMLDAALGAPELKGAWKDAKAAAVTRIRGALKKGK
jgi:hypothetical protein